MMTESGRLPDFLIVGAAKSATTSLYAYACDHPDIFMPIWKEPHFFAYAEHAPRRFVPAANLFQYANLFNPARPDQVIGEASTSYVYEYKKAIAGIQAAYGPDATKLKIIISLRNPADRAFSHYSMYRLYGLETLQFEEALRAETCARLEKNIDTDRFGIVMDYVRAGMYYEPVKAYMDAFPHVHIVLYDDIQRDAPAVMREIFNFLDVFPDFPLACGTVHNMTGAPRSRILNSILNRAHAFIMTKRSRIKSFCIWVINHFIDWESSRVIILRAVYRVGIKIERLNMRKAVMSPAAREHLLAIYRTDIQRLGALINRDLSVWLR